MEQEISIKMTVQEAVKYYSNKIIEDSLSECSEFNYCMDMDYYNDNGFIKEHQNQILEELKHDERIADVYIDKEHETFDMVFWTDYCPGHYEEYDLSKEIQSMILKKFVNQLIGLMNSVARSTNISTRHIIEGIINRNEFKNPLSIEEKGHAINMLKESICNTAFFNKYLDKYKVIVTKENAVELILELQDKIKQLESDMKPSVTVLSKQDVDTMLDIFNKDKIYPSKYIGLFMYIEDSKYLAIDNTSREMYIEEFDTEEECIKYLFDEDEEDNEE